MSGNESIVKPVRPKSAPDLGPLALIVTSEDDLLRLCSLLGLQKNTFTTFFASRMYIADQGPARFCMVGPAIGAPYAVLLLENLVARGVSRFIFFGWCGAVSPGVKIGDLIVPSGAVIDEGTSKHYRDHGDDLVYPAGQLSAKVKQILRSCGLDYHEGLVWSTDAIYRETPKKVEYFQKRDVLAVDMELSALFTVAKFLDVQVASILVVSDELSTFTWQREFKQKSFAKSRKAAAGAIKKLCNNR